MLRNRLVRILLTIVGILVLGYLLRFPLMRSAGNYLVYQNKLEQADLIVVLSGSAYDRAATAYEIYREGYASHILCTGKNVPHDFQTMGIDKAEAELTKIELENRGVPSADIEILLKGTSTIEEKRSLIEYCIANDIESCIIVSTKFHTRRIKRTFRKSFRKKGVQTIIRGASSSEYDESKWWENEYGLLGLNNEYVKLIYYSFKY